MSCTACLPPKSLNPLTTRAAAVHELDLIYRMGYDAWGDGKSLDDYLAVCRASKKYAAGVWWVQTRGDGRPVSALLTHEIPIPGDACAIGLGSIATAPDLRGQGHASRLIREVLSRHERDAGTEVFFLFADISPRFYERFGFVSSEPCPQKPQSMLMVRAESKRLASLLTDSKFKIPDYF